MMMKLNPNERLLIENGVNSYKVVGLGLVWLKPWQTTLSGFSVASRGQEFQFELV